MRESGDDTKKQFYSQFGGCWTDRRDADRLLGQKIDQGLLSPATATRLSDFIRDGFVILKGAVSTEVTSQIRADMEQAFDGKNSGIKGAWTEPGKGLMLQPVGAHLKEKRLKLLNLYAFSNAALQAIFAPLIANFVREVLGQPPLAFQSLSFTYGTTQPIHQDSAYVIVDAPMQFVASWIALEDVTTGSGALEYYPGSHKNEEYLFEGQYKKMPTGSDEHPMFLKWQHDESARRGLRKASFLAKEGDALIWASDLAHGGSDVSDSTATRKSLVTHYCPLTSSPEYYDYNAHSGKLSCGNDCYFTFKILTLRLCG